MVLNPSNTTTFAKYKDANTTFVLFLFFATTKAAQQLCCHRRRKRWQQCWDLQEDSFVPLEICQEKRHYFMLYSCFFSTDNTQSNTYPYALEYSAWFSQVKMINELLSAPILSHNVEGMSLVWFWWNGWSCCSCCCICCQPYNGYISRNVSAC